MKQEGVFEGVEPIDPYEEFANDQVKLEELKKRLKDLTEDARDDRHSDDARLIKQLETEIAELENKTSDSLTRVEFIKPEKEDTLTIHNDFEEFFREIMGMREIQGSLKKYSARELTGIIEEVRRINQFEMGKIIDIDKIPRTNFIREKVRGLIERERKISFLGKK